MKQTNDSRQHNDTSIAMEVFGKRLKQERQKLGLTQAALSKLTGKSRGQIINYEKARSETTAGFLARLARVGFDVQYLLYGVHSKHLS